MWSGLELLKAGTQKSSQETVVGGLFLFRIHTVPRVRDTSVRGRVSTRAKGPTGARRRVGYKGSESSGADPPPRPPIQGVSVRRQRASSSLGGCGEEREDLGGERGVSSHGVREVIQAVNKEP